jgi:hypothetical protein
MQGHAARGVHDINHVAGFEMGPGILGPRGLNPDPHRAGPKQNVYAPESSRRPVDEPQEMRPPHDPSPHRFAPATERASPIITPQSKP